MLKLNYPDFAKYYFFLAILIPNFYQFLNTRGAIFLNALLMTIPLIFFVLSRKNKFTFSIAQNTALLLFFLIQIWFFANINIGMLVGLASTGNDLNIRDFFELHRPVYNIIIFFVFYLLANQYWEKVNIKKTIDVAFLIIVLHGVIQYFQILEPITLSFIKHTNFSSGRLSAPFPNPYDFGFVMIFFCLYFFWEWINGNKKFPYKFLIGSILIALTQSRSIALSYLLIFTIVIPIISIYLKIRGKSNGLIKSLSLPLLVLIASFLLIEYYGNNLQYLVNGFIKIINNPLNNGVSTARVEQFIYALNYGPSNYLQLLLGNGPSKGTMDDVESIYTFYIFRYGFTGLIFCFFIILALGIYCCDRIIKNQHPTNFESIQFQAFQIWLLLIPICSFGSNHTEQIRVSFMYLAMIGIILGRYDSLYKGLRS